MEQSRGHTQSSIPPSPRPVPCLLPDTPAWDAYSLDDADDQLGHEGEEECHEAERAVSPEAEKMAPVTWKVTPGELGLHCSQGPQALLGLSECIMDKKH